jgi:hypothetical protein
VEEAEAERAGNVQSTSCVLIASYHARTVALGIGTLRPVIRWLGLNEAMEGTLKVGPVLLGGCEEEEGPINAAQHNPYDYKHTSISQVSCAAVHERW